MAYLRKTRAERGAGLLASTGLSVEEVARAVGAFTLPSVSLHPDIVGGRSRLLSTEADQVPFRR
jgi:hypothetical protein